ncbi:MAG TPA: hypothetical protein VHO90_20195 [Bacteroidales bacterium]|nr:hypothetical protein [Bacteroidales bacterium]
MQTSLKTEIENIKKKTDSERIKLKNKLLIYLFFLFISTIFWFLTAFNKNYSVQLDFPVRYYNFPPEKVVVSDVPHQLNLRINGHGFTIIKHKFYSGLSPLRVDVSASGITPIDTGSQLYFVLTRRFRERLASQIGEDLQVVSVQPDTLYFILDDIISKQVKVKPVVNLSYKKQYLQKGEAISHPDSIKVFGPRIIMDTLKWINTETIEKRKVNDTIRKLVDLVPVRTLQYSIDKVNVVVPVEKFTEKTLSIPIEAVNLPSNLILKTFPGFVTLSTMVSVSDYNKVSPDLFRAVVDYNDVLSGNSNKLKVTLAKAPFFIVNTKFLPKNVEFIIEK